MLPALSSEIGWMNPDQESPVATCFIRLFPDAAEVSLQGRHGLMENLQTG